MDSAYKILEIDSSASDNEVKKHTEDGRRYHQTRLLCLGKEIQKSAEEKFKAVSGI